MSTLVRLNQENPVLEPVAVQQTTIYLKDKCSTSTSKAIKTWCFVNWILNSTVWIKRSKVLSNWVILEYFHSVIIFGGKRETKRELDCFKHFLTLLLELIAFSLSHTHTHTQIFLLPITYVLFWVFVCLFFFF